VIMIFAFFKTVLPMLRIVMSNFAIQVRMLFPLSES
jgi:hypothetical protein